MVWIASPAFDVTDEIFTRPVDDVVEPRRDFIQENVLTLANLDVLSDRLVGLAENWK